MNDTLRILHIEDSPTDGALVKRTMRRLSRPFVYERIETRDELEAALEHSWDAIVCDWSLPRFDALQALQILCARGLDIPFIIVSGTLGEDTAVEAMQAGAHDYVLKDRMARLVPAVERELREADERRARREAEARLGRQEARFRAIIEKAEDVVLLANAEAVIEYVTPSCRKVLVWEPDELVGQSMLRIVPDDRHAIVRQILEHVAAVPGRQVPLTPRRVVRGDGSEREMEVQVINFLDDLDVRALVVHIVDRTEQRLAEAGKRSAEEALARSEEQLRHAQKMEAVGRLAGGVAHDFNNLLSIILSYGILMLEDQPPDSSVRNELEQIVKAGRRAAELTRQLLTFSRQQPMEAHVIDPNEVLTSLARMCRRLLGEDVTLELRLATDVGRIRIDPSGFEQIVMNLIVNARDAMPDGGRIDVETAAVQLDADFAEQHLGVQPGRYLMLAVSDDGHGMDRATQARIFEPFFTTKDRGKGTGLGLSMVFGLVQQSSGTIWVYSEPGRGTTFKIYLPMVPDLVPLTRPPMPRAVGRGTETVLLVEDEVDVRIVAHNLLVRFGYTVLEADSAEMAVALAASHRGNIDLLLTDVVLPGMSGPDLARTLRASRPRLQVLCMSGYTDDAVVRHGLIDAGMAFLQKPLMPAELATKLRRVLEPETTS